MALDLQITDDAFRALPDEDVVRAVDRAFRRMALGEVANPPRVESLGRPGEPDCLRLQMSARETTSSGWAATKVIEELPRYDRTGARLPGTRIALLTLHDPDLDVDVTADAEVLTNLRTATSALLATAYLVPSGPLALAVVGTGRIGREVVRLCTHVLDVTEFRVMSRTAENVERLVEELKPGLGAPIHGFTDIGEAIRPAKAVIAAVPSNQPLFSSRDVAQVGHLTLVGGDPRVILAGRDVWCSRTAVTDLHEQAIRSGDLIRAREEEWEDEIMWAERTVKDATVGRASLGEFAHLREKPTLALLTGVAALDLALAKLAWERDERRAALLTARNRS